MKYLACFSLLCSSMASAIERPNIIYIFTDQQTASAMSCAGNPDLHTPNLDRLAAAGILFNNAYWYSSTQWPLTWSYVYRVLSGCSRAVCQRITDARLS